jgi:hypothetical protein
MRAVFKMHSSLGHSIRIDLKRRHEFAYERVGFIACRAAKIPHGILVLAQSYVPLEDHCYARDHSVGARITSSAIRGAMQLSLDSGFSMFCVHMHEHFGIPRPSEIDIDAGKRLMPDFFGVTSWMPHGIIILSDDQAFGMCWLARESEPISFETISTSGAPIRLVDLRL